MRPERNEQHRGVEMLRGIAALMVVAAHYDRFISCDVALVRFAYTGVDLFFVLSGFVFAPYFISERPRWIPHLIRRAFRIYPLFLFALMIYMGLKRWAGDDIRYVWDHVSMTFTLHSREEAFYYNGAFWSLPPEIEFYLLLPVLSHVSRRRHGFTLLFTGAILLRGVVGWNLPEYPTVDGWLIASAHIPGLLSEFLMGVAAYKIASVPRLAPLLWFFGLLGVLLIYYWGIYIVSLHDRGGQALLAINPVTRGTVGIVAATGYALIVAGLGGWIHSRPWLSATAELAGGLSYGIYLFHNAAPTLLMLGFGLAGSSLAWRSLMLTLVVAAALHWVVENPARNFGRTLARRFA